MSKARNLAALLGGGSSGVIQFGGTGAIQVPGGTTAQRPTPANGEIRYNSDLSSVEVYAGGNWGTIAPPPSLSGVSPTTYNGEQGTSFTLTGAFLTADAQVKFVTSGGIEFSAASVTYVNSTTITATTPQDFTVAQEPLSVKVSQGSGQATLASAIDCGGVPTWNTASGTVATINDAYGSYSSVATLSAGDPDAGATIAYSVVSGSLPAGMSLNSSTGVISGDPNNIASQTTSNFTVAATDNAGNQTQRAFSIIVNPTADGSSSSRYATSAQALYNLGIRTNGYYYLNLGSSTQYIYCHLDGTIESGYGYMRVWDQRTATSSTEIQHFYTGNTDYAAFANAGGLNFVITHLAYATFASQSSLTKYTNNGGGMHSSLGTKSIATALAQSWTASGFETDNWKYFGSGTTAGTGPSTSQLFLLDDNDSVGTPAGRQTAKPGTPQGILIFPATSASSWADAGNQYYATGGSMDGTLTAFYIR